MPPVQTPEQRAAALRDAGVNPASLPISAPQPITYDVSNAANPATLYQMPVGGMPDYKATLASLPTSSVIAGEQSPEQIAAATEQKSLQQRILDSISGFGDKTAALDKTTGMSDTQSQLDEIYGQINGLQQEAQAIPLQVEEDSKGLGRTTGGIAPIEAGLTRTNAIKALGLSARASVLQGKLGQAKQQMDRLQQVQQTELDYLKTALQFNGSRMDDADKAQTVKIQTRLKERQDALDAQSKNDNAVMDILLKAKAAGAPDNLVARAHQLDPVGAMGVLAPYLTEAEKSSLMTVAAGSTVFDPKTGKPIYTAPAKPTAQKPISPDTVKFTDANLQTGAANASVPLATFKTWDEDTKNWFVRSFSTFKTQQDLINKGQKTKQEVARDIQSSVSIPATVKPKLLAILGVSAENAAAPAASGNWFTNSLSTVGKWLGI